MIHSDDGSVVAFPRMPRAAALPRGWRRWSPVEKIEHLLGMSLDQMHDVLSWRAGEADPYRLSVQWQVARVILMVGAKHLLAAERQQQRSAALEDLARGFNGERP